MFGSYYTWTTKPYSNCAARISVNMSTFTFHGILVKNAQILPIFLPFKCQSLLQTTNAVSISILPLFLVTMPHVIFKIPSESHTLNFIFIMSQAAFASKFTDLLALHSPVARTAAPQSFPFGPHAAPYVAQPAGAARDLELEVSVKCLRPKLALSLTYATTSTTLFRSLRGAIIQELAESGISVKDADLKLMVKTKTISDSTTIEDLLSIAGSSSQVALNAMIKAHSVIQPSTTETTAEASTPDSAPGSAAPTITDATWTAIHTALSNDLPADVASETLARFKAAVA